jgi:hypothetical protein
MYFKPIFAAEIIRCCVALHNLLMPEEEAAEILEEFDREHGADEDHDYFGMERAEGDITRQRQIIALF